MLWSISKTFIVISVFFVIILGQLGCGSASTISPASAKNSSDPSNAGKERVFQTTDLRDQCRAGNDNRMECEIDIIGRYLCEDCYNDVMVDVPAFVSVIGVTGIWEKFIASMGNVVSVDPLWLLPKSEIQEEHSACFDHGHSKSSVLGPPYFEDVSVCLYEHNTKAPIFGIGFRMQMTLSVSKNPHSPYREPEAGETSKYVQTLKQAYRKAIDLACLELQGRMSGMTCELSSP